MREMVFCYVLPSKEIELLREALRKRVRSGDVQAMEDMAALVFEGSWRNWNWRVGVDMEQLCWNLLKYIPSEMEKPARYFLLSVGLVSAEDTMTMRNFREGAECARKAAKQGSLAGMYYWLRDGLWALDDFSREDWEDVFLYYRTLMEQSYIPYVTHLDYFAYPSRLDGELLVCMYPKLEQEQLFFPNSQLAPRGELSYDSMNFYEARTAEEAAKLMDHVSSLLGMDFVLNSLAPWTGGRNPKIAPEAGTTYVARVKELADEGDPCALYVLGYWCEWGFLLPQNLGEAWKYYTEALKHLDPKDLTEVNWRDPFRENEPCLSKLPETLKMCMVSMVIRYADFPGRDPAAAYNWTKELAALHWFGRD